MKRQFMVVVTTSRYAQLRLLVITDMRTKKVIDIVREYLSDNEQFNRGDCTYEVYSVLHVASDDWSIAELSQQTGMYSVPMIDYDYTGVKRYLEFMITDKELNDTKNKGEQ